MMTRLKRLKGFSKVPGRAWLGAVIVILGCGVLGFVPTPLPLGQLGAVALIACGTGILLVQTVRQ